MNHPFRFIGIAAVTTLLAAGCGGSDGSGDGGQTAAPSGDISGKVTFWHAYSADSPEVETLEKEIIPAFEDEHPDVTVESVPVPYDQLHQKLITAAAGEELPDLVRSDIIWVPELAHLGVLEPLDELMPDFDDLAAQTFDGPLATNKWNDHYYGLPLDTNTRVLMWNEEALNAAGITRPPETFDDVREIAPKLAQHDLFVFADNGAGGWNVLPWIWSAGGDITDPDITTATGYLDSDESIAAVQLLVDLVRAGQSPDIVLGGEGGLATSDGLAQGKYATILDGPWMYPIFEGQYPDFELQAAPMPAGDGGSISVVGGEDVVMTKASDNKGAAAEFIRHLLSPESQLAMAEVGQMPVLTDASSELGAIHDYYPLFADQLESARPRPATPAWPKIDEVLQTEVRSAMQGEISVEDALGSAAEQIDALLSQYTS